MQSLPSSNALTHLSSCSMTFIVGVVDVLGILPIAISPAYSSNSLCLLFDFSFSFLSIASDSVTAETEDAAGMGVLTLFLLFALSWLIFF